MVKNPSVVIFAQKEPFFISRLILKLIRDRKEYNYDIKEVVFFESKRKNNSKFHWIQERLRLFSLKELLLLTYSLFYANLSKFFRIGPPNFRLVDYCNDQNISISKCRDVNSKKFVGRIDALNPDFIVSISCPQILKSDIISVPKVACLNMHSTLLPKHRGVQGIWWTLFNGDAEAGVTVHLINEEVDSGNIIVQKHFPIKNSLSQFKLAYITKRIGFFCIIESIIRMHFGNFREMPLEKGKGNYNYSPTLNEVREFQKKGNRVITVKDLNLILPFNPNF